MTDAWLDFLCNCRCGMCHAYDIVIGAMADDQIYNYVADYIVGILTRDQFWALANLNIRHIKSLSVLKRPFHACNLYQARS